MTSKWDAPGIAATIDDFWKNTGSDVVRQEVADWMGSQTGSFLDLGCGTARMAQFLKDCQYVGVDASEEMLRIAKTRVPSEFLCLADLFEKLPFADDSFRAALCMEVVRHLDSYESALKELARVVWKQVFIVDVFMDGETSFGEERISGQVFPNNCWSLSQFLADVERYFSGWRTEVHGFRNGELGIRIEAL